MHSSYPSCFHSSTLQLSQKANLQKSKSVFSKMLHSSIFFPTCSRTSPSITNRTTSSFCFTTPFSYHRHRHQWQLKQPKKKEQLMLSLCANTTSYEVGGGYPDEDLDVQDRSGRKRKTTTTTQQQGNSKLDTSQYETLLKGGEQVTSVLQEMITLVIFYTLSYLMFRCRTILLAFSCILCCVLVGFCRWV